MGLLRRLGGALVLLLSTVGIVGCVAGIIGIWTFYDSVSERAQKISGGLDDGLQRVSAANQNVQGALAKARADLAKVHNESADLGVGAQKGRRRSGALGKLIQEQLGPKLEDLGGRLATLSDGAVAVSALLQSFQELASTRSGRITPAQLQDWSSEAQQLSATIRRLQAVAGDEDNEGGAGEVSAAAGAVNLVLEKCQTKVDGWQSELDGVREDFSRLRAEIRGWVRIAAVAAILLCVWVALGQASLAAHAFHWCKG